MSPSTMDNQAHPLADYVLKLFAEASRNRKTLEEKWERNREAFRRITTGQWKVEEGQAWRSQATSGLTKGKVVMAYAQMIDSVLTGGRIPFMMKASPEQQERLNELPPELSESADDQREKMQRKIEEQLLDCHADRNFMKNMFSCALYGETSALGSRRVVVKKRRRPRNLPDIEDTSRIPAELVDWESYDEKRIGPTWEYWSVWNVFRDMEVDDLEECAYIFLRVMKSAYWLRSKKGKRYFDDDAIDAAIEEAKDEKGTGSTQETDVSSLPPGLRDVKHRQNTIRYLELRGRVPRNLLEQYEDEIKTKKNSEYKMPSIDFDNVEDDGDEVEVILNIAGTKIVRCIRSTPKERLVFQSKWEDNLDDVGGTGAADNVEDAHRMQTGALRSFEDNTRLSSAFILALKERYLENPEDFDKGLLKGVLKLLLSEDCEDARQAVQQINIKNIGRTLLEFIALLDKKGDEESLIPKISQGIQVEKDATAYELSTQVDKAGKYYGMAIRNQDEGLIEPIITYFYEYNMDDPDLTEGKGDYVAKALGCGLGDT